MFFIVIESQYKFFINLKKSIKLVQRQKIMLRYQQLGIIDTIKYDIYVIEIDPIRSINRYKLLANFCFELSIPALLTISIESGKCQHFDWTCTFNDFKLSI